MPLGVDEGTLHGPAEKAPALPMPGSGLWEKTIALTFKKMIAESKRLSCEESSTLFLLF